MADKKTATPGVARPAIHPLPIDARSFSTDDARWNNDGRHLLVLDDLVVVLLDDGKHGRRSG